MPIVISDKSEFYSPDSVLSKFNECVSSVNDDIASHCIHPGSDFSRNRLWNFPKIIDFLLKFQSKSMNSELCEYFTCNEEDSGKVPWNSGLIQQRDKLKLSAFCAVLHKFNSSFGLYRTCNGYTILAHDGSVINIAYDPKDKQTRVRTTGINDISQYHLNGLYDCINNIYWDIDIDTASKTGEKASLKRMIQNKNYPEKSIITADRGYENYDLIACCIENNQKFAIRVKDIYSHSSILYGLDLPDEEFDITVTRRITRKQTNEIKVNRSLYKILPANVEFNYIDEKTGYYEMTFRVVRFKLDNGEYECIVTNLEKEEFDVKDIKELYHMRWTIEVSYDKLKNVIGMTNFHSRKRNLIQQEIMIRIILYNLIHMIAMNVKLRERKSKYKYKININQAITNIRMFLNKKLTQSQLTTRLNQYLTEIKLNRSYKRDIIPGRLSSFNHKTA